MIALAIALLLMQQPQGWVDLTSGRGGARWGCSTYWNDEPVALPPSAQCTPDQFCTGTANPAIPSPEPFDVPPIQSFVTAENGQNRFSHYTCSDKSRVLLTSENGVPHCLKF